MGSFFLKLFRYRALAIVWTLLTIFLLCLPGSSLPGEGFFAHIPYFDKIIHITLFGGIAFLWGGFYAVKAAGNSNWPRKVWYAALGSCGLGIVLEFVQLYFIPDRSFDGYDIIADTTGAVLAALFLLYVFPKKSMVN